MAVGRRLNVVDSRQATNSSCRSADALLRFRRTGVRHLFFFLARTSAVSLGTSTRVQSTNTNVVALPAAVPIPYALCPFAVCLQVSDPPPWEAESAPEWRCASCSPSADYYSEEHSTVRRRSVSVLWENFTSRSRSTQLAPF